MTYYDRLNFFFRFLDCNNLKPSSQLVYLHLLQFQNELRGQLAFYVSDRTLSQRTNLSVSSIFESRQVLKNFGLLNFKVVNGRVKYFLPENFEPNAFKNDKKTEAEHEPNGARGSTIPRDSYPKTETESRRARRAEDKSVGNPPTPPPKLKYKTPLELEWEEREKALKSPEVQAQIKSRLKQVGEMFSMPF